MKKLISKFQPSELLAYLVLLTTPQLSHATSIESILNRTVTYLQGPVARLVGLVAILCTGYLCIVSQKIPKQQFMMILLGLGIIFGGSSIYNSLVG